MKRNYGCSAGLIAFKLTGFFWIFFLHSAETPYKNSGCDAAVTNKGKSFVATSILSVYVATKDVFCRDKHMFVATNSCL